MNNEKDVVDFEASMHYMVEKSNKRAWGMAWFGMFLAAAALTALFLIMPLKTSVPYILKVDKDTGVVNIETVVDKKEMTENEAVSKFFASSYVMKREGYYYNFLSKDYYYVQLHSTPQVAKDYRKIYDGTDNSRDKKLGDKFFVEVDIISAVPGESAGIKNMTVRFILKTVDSESRMIKESIKKIVILSYKYYPESELTEEERISNPLGFKVLDYRVNSEIHNEKN